MTLKTAEPAQTAVDRDEAKPASMEEPSLPTFDLEVGWKYVYNPEAGRHDQVPLTLLDVLYPQEDEAIVMPESPYHDLWVRVLAFMLESFLADWLILSDVLIHPAREGVPAKAPDVAAIPGGRLPDLTDKSYHVERDGPVPAFVVEVTSEDTRVTDFDEKTLYYAAVGIREMLIVDFWPEDDGPWQLFGYRLEDSPYYRELGPDPEGGLTFKTVGLRFVAVGRERIDVYDAETGERLFTPEELREYAEAEAAARAEAEARAAELQARVAELEARYGVQTDSAAGESSEDDGDGDA
ncbi:MAG: hypothetical protein MAG451_01228 [Anaerolineales bacterium]|nr:hypothetical protein [Anaerolineales bacterium]